MTSDWKLIAAGFVVAGTGAVATMLFIVGLSAAYIGRYAAGAVALGGAGVLALLFHRMLGHYLDTLDARAGNAGDGDDGSEPNP
jgi:hypothetical protein